MIWTITPNPAIDVTYRIPELRHGETHRVNEVQVNPGGKGINVARVLTQLGEEAGVSGLVGGATGTQLRELLAERAPTLIQDWVPAHVPTRTSIAVVDDRDATVFNEAGATPRPEVWQELRGWMRRRIQPGDVVTICGSLPGDTPGDTYADLARTARELGAHTIVDTSGPALLAAAPYVDLIKPNEAELLVATGAPTLAEALAQLHIPGAVALSRGADGMELHLDGQTWRGCAPEVIAGNPTGAGDAAVAASARFLAHGSSDWAEGLRSAIATSAAAVARPTAGEIDPDLRGDLLARIQIS